MFEIKNVVHYFWDNSQFSKGMLPIMLIGTVILDLLSFSCYDDRYLVL
jgi:hypothetical protein